MKNNIIINFLKNNKITYVIGIFFMFLSSYIQTLFPKLLGKTIDILKQDYFSAQSVRINILYMLLVAVGTFTSTYIWRNLVIGNARKLECHLREVLFKHFQILSPEFYNKKKTGDLIAYSINDISAIRMTFGPATAMSINGLVICVASIYSMSQAINWKLTLMCLLPIPLIIFFMLNIGSTVRTRFKVVQENFASVSDRIQENIYGVRIIKTFVQEDLELNAFEKLSNNMLESNLAMVRTSSILTPIIEICFSISFILNLIIGGNMVLSGTISLGGFIAFNTYLTMIMAPVISIGRVLTIFQRGMASLKRLNEILEVEPTIKDTSMVTTSSIKGSIEIKNLNFSYPNSQEKVLNNINLKIPKGHVLGIIGKTGSGKSTLTNLLLKLYNVKKGSIFIDGKDINEYSLDNLRNSFGYVPQDNFLFSSTISNNIKFFKNIYSNDEVFNSAKSSCIYDSIIDFPKGFDTDLGERGVNVSGGEKQRISIARALIKKSEILILDDALSAVDSITEKEILKNLRINRKGKTSIIISHRISVIKEADEIIVLSNGEIVEKGTHIELLKKGGSYHDIYKEQTKDTNSSQSFEVS